MFKSLLKSLQLFFKSTSNTSTDSQNSFSEYEIDWEAIPSV